MKVVSPKRCLALILYKAEHGLTNTDIGKWLGLKSATICKKINGDSPFFDYELVIIRQKTGISYDELLKQL